jgi:diacylglycerol kinase family enzyme
MGGIGIVNNPRSWRNQRRPATAARLARLLGDDGILLDASTPDELAAVAARLRALGVDTLAVNGGDGTTRRALTALAAASPAPLPRLLPLRGGRMNTLAGNHGWRGTPERILHEVVRLRRAGRGLPSVPRDLLSVEVDGDGPQLAFLFGTGTVVAFLEAAAEAEVTTPLGAGLLLGRAAVSALWGGRLATRLTRREALRVEADDEEWPDPSWLAVLAGTVPEAGLGFRALARCDEQPGFFHAVGIHGTLGQVVRMLWRVRRGLPWRRRAAVDGVARRLTLEGAPFWYALDGDRCGPAGRVLITTGPPIEVLVPPRRRRAFDPDRARG